MYHSKQTTGRLLGAWVCIFAAVFLYAPLGAASWSAHAMNCCTGDHCPIAHHHHTTKQAAPPDATDCGHDMGGMMNCSVSCCQSSEMPLVTAVAFVLPDPTPALAPAAAAPVPETARAIEIPRSVKPLSPPPRFADAL